MSERLLRDRVLDVLRAQSLGDSFFVEPAIPPRKLANLRAQCRIPSTEPVLAIIDCTVFGSAKNGAAFGEHAFYYHNSWSVSSSRYRGPGILPYGDFAAKTFAKGFMEVRWEGGAVEVAGSNIGVQPMIDLLDAVKHAIGDHDLEYGASLRVSCDPVSRLCLEPSNEIWPNGIATYADASFVFPPLAPVWERELEANVVAPVALHRDMAIVLVGEGPLHANRRRLVAHELTTGRVFWRREIETPHALLVAYDGAIFVKRRPHWFAFDIETGAPRRETTPLARPLRDQLLLAEADIDEPASYCDFVTNLDTADLAAANLQRRLYLEDLAVVTLDWHGARRSWPVDVREIAATCMTERFVVLGLPRRLRVLDATDAGVAPYDVELGFSPTQISAGSDHLLVGGGSRLACFRGSSPSAWRDR